jgi:hypothetical protein
MLAYYVEWHMRERLKPVLFDDAETDHAERVSIVAPAQPSPSANAKRATKRTRDGLPVHSFQTLLRDLATCTLNQTTIATGKSTKADIVARPTQIQAKAFELLSVDPNRTQ